MKAYEVIPGCIASACHVNTPEGEQWNCIYMSENRLPELSPSEEVLLNRRFSDLPLAVRASVNKHFGALFSLPVEQREGYLKNCVPWTVEVEE